MSRVIFPLPHSCAFLGYNLGLNITFMIHNTLLPTNSTFIIKELSTEKMYCYGNLSSQM